MKKHTIYLIGIGVFAMLYAFLKTRIPDLAFLALALVYAVALNIIAHKVGKSDPDKEP